MDYHLVRKWLNLPPGPWPPDHYTLLGVTPGFNDPAAVEPIVLDRMDRLRPHQLRQPELVTEGMNRLAQALITLTDPAEKAAYDAELGIVVPPPPSTIPIAAQANSRVADAPGRVPLVIAQPVVEDTAAEEVLVGIRADPDATQPIEIPAFEVLPAAPVRGTLVVSTAEYHAESVPAALAGPARFVEAIALRVGDSSRDMEPASRRWIYTRLALMRRAIRAWEQLRPIAVDTEDALDRPGRVLLLIEASAALRPVLSRLQGLLGDAGLSGQLTLALLRGPFAADKVRGLLPDQRQALAADWQAAFRELHLEYARLRGLSCRGRRSDRNARSHAPRLGNWLRDNPEWAVLLLAVLVAFLAALRSPP